MKLDLGCGNNKHAGFYGIDIRPLEEVDLVWDLNQGIPLPDQSVEWVMISRFAPYVERWEDLMKEIYRVCIHKAVICILAPYAHSFRHMTNPRFRHKFDEHSPRYWTGHFFQPPLGPRCPQVPGYSEDLNPPFDFRLIRMELFFAENFRPPLYDLEELEMLLSLQVNVADEIMYHLTAVKEVISDSELDLLSRQTYPEPSYVAGLRLEQESTPGETEPPPMPELAHHTDSTWEPPAPAQDALPVSQYSRFRKKSSRMPRNRKKRSRIHHELGSKIISGTNKKIH